MEIFPVIFFLVFVGIVLVNVIGFIRGNGNWTRAFEQIANRYGGWYSAARATRPPVATFKYKSSDVRIKCRRSSRDRGTPETEFRIKWPDRYIKMEIVPIGQQPRFRALKNSPRVLADDEKFDNQFGIFAGIKRREDAKGMISAGVRWQVLQLKNLLDPVPVHVAFEKGWLIVRKKCYIKDPQTLDDYVRFCLELFDQFGLTMTEGIEFRDDMVMTAVEEVRCPICGSDIDGKMVICIRCKTPHCLDCWQYNVKCGMYACDETRYLMVGGD